MSLATDSTAEALLQQVIRIQGKLQALQRANVFSLTNTVPARVSEKVTLSHAVSALSTDCPEESTDGARSPVDSDDQDDEVVHDDDSSSSSSE